MIKKIFKKILLIVLGVGMMIMVSGGEKVMAQETEESFTAEVVEIVNEQMTSVGTEGMIAPDTAKISQELKLKITSGEKKGQEIVIFNQNEPLTGAEKYAVGDKVVVGGREDWGGYYITDVVRWPMLLILAVIFVVAAILVGRRQSLASLIGLGLSFVIIFYFVLPKIAAGNNPILIVILASMIIIPLIFALSHGFNKKTLVAMIATLITLIITGSLIVLFVNLTELTGTASEEAGFLQAMNPDFINLKNLLIAGMLIGVLGLLDDITISQAGIVMELKTANQQLTRKELYTQAMHLGRDHIASMINTLFLVYAGASFPLLLLITNNNQSLALTLNYEMMADEIVRTLTGSLGLILAVPLTTFLAVVWATKPEASSPKKQEK